MSLASRIASALAECDALALAIERASTELRKAHTAAQNACATALVEIARVKREMREIDADLTPVRPGVQRVTAHVTGGRTLSGTQSKVGPRSGR